MELGADGGDVAGIDLITRDITKDPRETGGAICDPAFSQDEARSLAPANEQVFLGLFDGGSRFGIGITQVSAEKLKERSDLEIIDLRRAVALARRHKLVSIIDNTFASPYLCRPIEHGANIVVDGGHIMY
mgnify:CR=1 FL=1